MFKITPDDVYWTLKHWATLDAPYSTLEGRYKSFKAIRPFPMGTYITENRPEVKEIIEDLTEQLLTFMEHAE